MMVDDALLVLESLDYRIWFHSEVRILAQHGTLFSIEWHRGNWMVCVNRLPPLVIGITCDLLQTIQIVEDFRHTLRNNYNTDRLLTSLQLNHFHSAVIAPNRIAVYSLFYAWERVEFYTFIQTNFNAINYADPAIITVSEDQYIVTTGEHEQSFADVQAVTDFLKDNRYLFFPWI
jgi:aspartate 1-decarboxylase